MRHRFLLLLLLCGFMSGARAQSKGELPPVSNRNQLYRFSMTDSKQFVGRIVQEDSVNITISSGGKRYTYPRAAISSLDLYVQPQQSELPNLLPSQMGLEPTAIPLKRGEVYYRNVLVLSNELGVGLTDRITLRANVLVSYFGSIFTNRRLNILPRISAQYALPVGQQAHVSFGVAGMFVRDFFVISRLDIYGLSGRYTVGDTERNFTVGYTYNIISSDQVRGLSANQLHLALVRKLGSRTTFITDNTLTFSRLTSAVSSSNNPLNTTLMGLIRLNRPRHAFDIGAGVSVNNMINRTVVSPSFLAAYNLKIH